MNPLVVRKVNGVETTSFQPSPTMRLYALAALADPECIGKDPEDICAAVGIGRNSFKRFQEFNPYFEEWLEEIRLTMGGKNKKLILELVGMEEAMKGNFNFWKAMAIKHGVISPDQLNVGAAIPSNLGNFQGMSDAELNATENTIMAALRGQADPATIDLSEGPTGWGPEGDPPGAAAVCEVPVVLHPQLGSDRERALDGLDAF